MSHEWSLRCKTDGAISETEMNHGEHVLSSVVAAYPHIKAARAIVHHWLETSILGDHNDLIGFLSDHEGHEFELLDEYGHTKPLNVATPTKEIEIWRHGERDFMIRAARHGDWILTPDQALALLTGLDEFRETLERLVKERGQ